MLNRAKRAGLIEVHVFENEVKVGRIVGYFGLTMPPFSVETVPL